MRGSAGRVAFGRSSVGKRHLSRLLHLESGQPEAPAFTCYLALCWWSGFGVLVPG